MDYDLNRHWDDLPTRCIDPSCRQKLLGGMMLHAVRKQSASSAAAGSAAAAACGGYSRYSLLDRACGSSRLQLAAQGVTSGSVGLPRVGVDPAFNKWVP